MSRQKLIFVLVAVLCLPAATLAWLGVRLLDLDNALEAQRQTESREQAADRAVQVLSAIVSDPVLLTRDPGTGALVATIPGGKLLFHSQVAGLPEAPAAVFAAAEKLEVLDGSRERAADQYRKLANSADPLVRAGALLRLARTLRNSSVPAKALRVYDELEAIESAGAGGWPTPLTAAWGRCTLLETLGRKQELIGAAARLRARLDERRWPLTRPSYEAFASDAERWTGIARPKEIELLTQAVNDLTSAQRAPESPPEGMRLVTTGGVPITLIWRRTPDRLVVFAAAPDYIQRHWLPRAGHAAWLKDDAGRDLTRMQGYGPAMRYAGQTRLPWTVAVATPPRAPEIATRSRLLMLLLAAVGIFSAAGGYFVVRALLREFALARMQEDFVAAVSHEFRTPLTALLQIGESLEDGRVSGEEHRNAYYRSLTRATRRLHRLVEDLLDFRKMQSGAAEYRKASLDVNSLVRDTVAGFQREVQEQGFRIELRPCQEARVTGDREALGRALWNLLDNAVKYSGASRDIEVAVDCKPGAVEVSVHDRGMGIQEREREQVFSRFYRGEQARAAGIRGTGIGLAMVKQIAEAHGGHVSVESEPGAGSTFTVVVPREENGWHAS